MSSTLEANPMASRKLGHEKRKRTRVRRQRSPGGHAHVTEEQCERAFAHAEPADADEHGEPHELGCVTPSKLAAAACESLPPSSRLI